MWLELLNAISISSFLIQWRCSCRCFHKKAKLSALVYLCVSLSVDKESSLFTGVHRLTSRQPTNKVPSCLPGAAADRRGWKREKRVWSLPIKLTWHRPTIRQHQVAWAATGQQHHLEGETEGKDAWKRETTRSSPTL